MSLIGGDLSSSSNLDLRLLSSSSSSSSSSTCEINNPNKSNFWGDNNSAVATSLDDGLTLSGSFRDVGYISGGSSGALSPQPTMSSSASISPTSALALVCPTPPPINTPNFSMSEALKGVLNSGGLNNDDEDLLISHDFGHLSFSPTPGAPPAIRDIGAAPDLFSTTTLSEEDKNNLVVNLAALAKLNELQEQQQQQQLPINNSCRFNQLSLDEHYMTDYSGGGMASSMNSFDGFPRNNGYNNYNPRSTPMNPRVNTVTLNQSLLDPPSPREGWHHRRMYDQGNNAIPSINRYGLASPHGMASSMASSPPSFYGMPNQMHIRCKFGQLGSNAGMFNAPHGFCMGYSEEIVVADTQNHRIQVFNTDGHFRYEFGNAGKDEGCLWYPRKVAVSKITGNFIVCDRGGERSRMQIFSATGQFIRKIPIRFIDIVAGLAINKHGEIVAVDSVTPTVFVISESGVLIRYHECNEFMSEPSDIAIYGDDYYICDFKGHSVVVISEDGRLVRRIGRESETPYPNGIDISDAGDVLIGDSHGNQFHVAVYSNDGKLLSQFTCPNVKVSRCCGLKITSKGYVVTLAKNNHHVLVLNTLYIN